MPRQVFDYDPPDRFVAGTVGAPGQRTFFLQARAGSRLTSVALEKTQVTALAERIDGLLDDVVRRTAGSTAVPAIAPMAPMAQDNDPLDTPIEEEFRVGDMSLLWDEDTQRVVVTCYAQAEVADGADPETDPDADEPAADDDEADRTRLRVSVTGSVARSFAKRALAVVAAGRPPCPFCNGPLDPQGHICPRANGYRR